MLRLPRLARHLAQLDQKLGGLRRRYPSTAEAPDALPAMAPKVAQTHWAQLQKINRRRRRLGGGPGNRPLVGPRARRPTSGVYVSL